MLERMYADILRIERQSYELCYSLLGYTSHITHCCQEKDHKHWYLSQGWLTAMRIHVA